MTRPAGDQRRNSAGPGMAYPFPWSIARARQSIRGQTVVYTSALHGGVCRESRSTRHCRERQLRALIRMLPRSGPSGGASTAVRGLGRRAGASRGARSRKKLARLAVDHDEIQEPPPNGRMTGRRSGVRFRLSRPQRLNLGRSVIMPRPSLSVPSRSICLSNRLMTSRLLPSSLARS